MNSGKALSGRDVIIFDFDGTIADTKAGIISTAISVLTEWGLGPDELVRVGDIIGPPFPQAYQQVFGLSHEDAVEVTRRYREIYVTLGIEAWPAFPGMPALLADLVRAGKRLAIASSKRTDLVRRALSDNGLLECFACIRAKEHDSEATKADAIAEAMRSLDATVDDAVMVGDRHHDVEAARACQIPCVGVRYGGTSLPGELEGADAAAVVSTVDELRPLLLGAPH